MQRTLVGLACALALAAGSAMAQQQPGGGIGLPPTDNPSGASITERARQAAQALGEKTRKAAATAMEKAQEAAQKAKSVAEDRSAPSGAGTRTMGAAAAGGSMSPALREKQKRADADYKSAKDKCEAIQQPAQKNLCEKQAAAAHANAEVAIAKAQVQADGVKASTAGGGRSGQQR
ncbi:MAG TPA: hypothetical protein VHL79_24075 [Ramlibacter sp.]|jgi:hypothetical protein|nr:hypothetical protein [Ramlibacter sp.]